MNEPAPQQGEVGATPGAALQVRREALGLSQREVAERLHLLPHYVDLLERDDYHLLRSPAFARGYVSSYGRLLELNESELLRLFDSDHAGHLRPASQRVQSSPPQLQRTGVGVVVGLGALLLLVAVLWWWQSVAEEPSARAAGPEASGAAAGSTGGTGEL